MFEDDDDDDEDDDFRLYSLSQNHRGWTLVALTFCF